MNSAQSFRLCIYLALVALCQTAWCQPAYHWSIPIGAANLPEQVRDIAADGSGNIVVAGIFEPGTDFDPGTGTYTLTNGGGQDVYVAKYTPGGALSWAISAGTAGIDDIRAIAITTAGNIIVTGDLSNTMDLDPGPGVASFTPMGGNINSYVATYSSTGAYINAFVLQCRVNDLATDAADNLYMTGNMSGTIDADPGLSTYTVSAGPGATDKLFVAKYTATGALAWAMAPGSDLGQDHGASISVDGSGNSIVAGFFRATSDFDAGASTATLASAGFSDAFMAKYNSSGAYQWAIKIGDSGYDAATAVTTDLSGNIYLTGYYSYTVDLDAGSGTALATTQPSNSAANHFFVAKYSSSGNHLWSHSSGNEDHSIGNALVCDNSSNLYLCGGAGTGTLDLDPGSGVITVSAAVMDFFIAKYNSSGSLDWAFDSDANDASATAVAASNGSVYLAGEFNGTTDFNPGAGTANMTAAGSSGSDGFIAKYSACTSPPAQPGVVAGPDSVCSGLNYVYSITPVNGAVSYSWALPAGWAGGSPSPSVQVTPAATGIISVTAVNACGSSQSRTLAVVANTIPVVAASSGSVCENSTYTIQPSGASSYAITGGSFIVSPPVTTTYIVTGINGVCSATVALTVSVEPQPTLMVSSNNYTVCAGEVGYAAASGADTYTWSTGSNFYMVADTLYATTIFSVAGTYTYNGCVSNPESVTIYVLPTPTVTITGDSVVCSGKQAILTASGQGVVSYLWSTSAIGPVLSVTPFANMSYSVLGTNSDNCYDMAVFNVSVLPAPTVSVTGPSTVCAGDSVTLTAHGAAFYLWSTGSTMSTAIVSPTSPLSYTVTGTNVNGCDNTTGHVVMPLALPPVYASPATVQVCEGDLITIHGNGASTYSWNTGHLGTPLTFTATTDTVVTVTGTNDEGCSAGSSATVSVKPLPDITITASDDTICEGEIAELSALSQGAVTWAGMPPGPNVIVSPVTTSAYVVTSSLSGCVSGASVTITVETCNSTGDILNSGVRMYPNPVFDQLLIEGVKDGTTYRIVNPLGQAVRNGALEAGINEVNMRELPRGVYYFFFSRDGKAGSGVKVIKD